jgi:hypothetical protein
VSKGGEKLALDESCLLFLPLLSLSLSLGLIAQFETDLLNELNFNEETRRLPFTLQCCRVWNAGLKIDKKQVGRDRREIGNGLRQI